MNAKNAPAPLVRFVSDYICGKDDDDDGYAGRSTNALRRALDIQEALDDLPHCPNHPTVFCEDDQDYANSLLEMQAAYKEEADQTAAEMETLLRLLDHDRMGEAFDLLNEQFDDDTSWPVFAQSALMSRADYAVYRRLEKEAGKLAKDIANSALALAKLIRQIQETGVALPDRLEPHRRKDEWGSFCGRTPEARHLQLVQYVYSTRKTLPDTIPDLENELNCLAKDLSGFVPDLMSPALRAATANRQISKKSSYIRAFCAQLEEGHISITPSVKRAMAIIATAIFDDASMEFSEDDVRKAIDRRRDNQAQRTTPKHKRD